MKGFTNLLLVTISSCFHQQQVVVPHLFRDVYLEKRLPLLSLVTIDLVHDDRILSRQNGKIVLIMNKKTTLNN